MPFATRSPNEVLLFQQVAGDLPYLAPPSIPKDDEGTTNEDEVRLYAGTFRAMLLQLTGKKLLLCMEWTGG